MLMPVSPKHYHLGFVKIFPELSGTESGPLTCLSQCLRFIAVIEHTQHKTERILLFYFLSSFYQPLSPPASRACLCPLSYTFSSTFYPHSSQITGEVLPCSEGLFPFTCSCAIQNYYYFKNSQFLDHLTKFQILF